MQPGSRADLGRVGMGVAAALSAGLTERVARRPAAALLAGPDACDPWPEA